ncbi:hypothetical protein FNV43_RR17040 [Rhamnella rubrinervis]|uniref:Uncharacterized protein n=1 Tax=Rhamnella rubrinervis TaxID=2594499 RepID=A0A8K0MD17_9ROSA|nr:hypothetical protein FNV43_RR17040 [Rhamnella rubrinervis]
MHQDLERKNLEVLRFLSGFSTTVPLVHAGEALTEHLAYLGFEGPCVAEVSSDDKDPEKSENLEEEEDPEEFPAKD